MEKRKPTYDVEAFEDSANETGRPIATRAVLEGAAVTGFGRDDLVSTILTMRRSHFYKSTTVVSIIASEGHLSRLPCHLIECIKRIWNEF